MVEGILASDAIGPGVDSSIWSRHIIAPLNIGMAGHSNSRRAPIYGRTSPQDSDAYESHEHESEPDEHEDEDDDEDPNSYESYYGPDSER